MNDLHLENAHWAPAQLGRAWDQAWGAFMLAPGLWLRSGLVYLGVVFAPALVCVFAWLFHGAVAGEYALYDLLYLLPAFAFRVNHTVFVVFRILNVCSVIAVILWSVIIYRNAARVAAGKKLTWRDFFSCFDILRGCVVGFLCLVCVAIGVQMFIIPGVVVFCFCYFAPMAVFSMAQPSVVGAFAASIRMLRANPAATLLVIVVSYALSAVGGVFTVAMVLTLPLGVLLGTFAFRNSVVGAG